MRTRKDVLSRWIGYMVAVATTGLVILLREGLELWLDRDAPLLMFVVTTIAAAWFGGLGPGLLATALSAAVGAYYFAQPSESLWINTMPERLWLAAFITVGVLVSLVCEALHRARRRAEASARKALEGQRRLEQADRRKDEFLAMLAHELRNPLSAISSAVAIMERTAPGDARLRKCQDTVGRQTELLTRLVEDLSDLSRIGRGKLELHMAPVDLEAVIESAVESSLPLINAHGHHLEIIQPECPTRVQGDSVRLAQVVTNLLNNAAKYTPDGGAIRLATGVEGDEAVLRVRDSGVGIPADRLPRVFDLFMQEERSLARSEGGLGIGLSLVRRLIELHGGTAAALSDGPGRGSEFVIRLPLSTESLPPGDTHELPRSSARTM